MTPDQHERLSIRVWLGTRNGAKDAPGFKIFYQTLLSSI